MPKLEVNGETLSYMRAGKGAPLLLVHSLGTGSWMWSAEVARWSQRFDVIAIDARGHGESTHNGPVTVEAIAADLRAAIGVLGVGPARVVAISMGGPIAAHMYAAAPQLVERLVIADSFARQGEAGAARVRGLEETLKTTPMAGYAAGYATGTLRGGAESPHFDMLVQSVAAMDRDVYLQIAGSVFTSDVADLMGRITAPTHVVVGDVDTRTPPAMSEEIARLIPGASLQMIPNAAHLANLDNPEGFYAAVEPFLMGAPS